MSVRRLVLALVLLKYPDGKRIRFFKTGHLWQTRELEKICSRIYCQPVTDVLIYLLTYIIPYLDYSMLLHHNTSCPFPEKISPASTAPQSSHYPVLPESTGA